MDQPSARYQALPIPQSAVRRTGVKQSCVQHVQSPDPDPICHQSSLPSYFTDPVWTLLHCSRVWLFIRYENVFYVAYRKS